MFQNLRSTNVNRSKPSGEWSYLLLRCCAGDWPLVYPSALWPLAEGCSSHW